MEIDYRVQVYLMLAVLLLAAAVVMWFDLREPDDKEK